PLEGLDDALFRAFSDWGIDVRAVAQKNPNAALPEGLATKRVRQMTRSLAGVEIEVAGVKDGPDGSIDGERGCIDDRVSNRDALHGEGTELGPRANGGLHDAVAVELVIGEALPDEGARVGRREDPGDLLQVPDEVGERADVVFMTMSDEDRFDAVFALIKPRKIRVQNIDP